jgi:hypothetical protein
MKVVNSYYKTKRAAFSFRSCEECEKNQKTMKITSVAMPIINFDAFFF